MPHYTCACGEVLRYGGVPCDIMWKIIHDPEMERWGDNIPLLELEAAMRFFLRCPRCQRLWVHWKGWPPTEYVPVSLGDPIEHHERDPEE